VVTADKTRLSAMELVGEARNDAPHEFHHLAGREAEQDIRNRLQGVLELAPSSANGRGDTIGRRWPDVVA